MPEKSEERKVVHPYEVDRREVRRNGNDLGPLTANEAKELLGWESEEDYIVRLTEGLNDEQKKKMVDGGQAAFGDKWDIKDFFGSKVRLLNNHHNRPFNPGHAATLAQEILNLKWRHNMENIIIGEYGNVLSGQHRLAALVLASQEWVGKDPDSEEVKHWRKLWPEEPTIETDIAYGGKEEKDYVRTIDNVRPRSLGDVLYTEGYFGKLTNKARISVTKMLDHAVRFLWQRTRANKDAFAPRRTHSEALEFIDRHKRLLKCCEHIWHIYGGRAEATSNWRVNTRRLGAGYAAAIMYLMASADTDGDAYRASENPSERKMVFDKWDQAEMFWSLLTSEAADELSPVRAALGTLADPEVGQGSGSLTERAVILTKAWNVYLEGTLPSDEDLALEYEVDQDGFETLSEEEYIDFGGIDLGPPKPKKKEVKDSEEDDDEPAPPEDEAEDEGGEESPQEEEVPEEELEERKKEAREKTAKKIMESRKKKSTSST